VTREGAPSFTNFDSEVMESTRGDNIGDPNSLRLNNKRYIFISKEKRPQHNIQLGGKAGQTR